MIHTSRDSEADFCLTLLSSRFHQNHGATTNETSLMGNGSGSSVVKILENRKDNDDEAAAAVA